MSMNREQLIRICLDSGVVRRDVAIKLIETIEANEREACAKVLEDRALHVEKSPKPHYGFPYFLRQQAEAIRTRGQQ